MLYVARCQVELGNLREAYSTFEELIELAEARAKTEAKYAPTRDSAKQEAAELAKKVALVTVDIINGQGGSVTLGGTALPAAKWGKPILVDPGALEARLSMPGRTAIVKSVTAETGNPQRVELDGTPPAPIVSSTPIEDGPEEPPSGGIKPGWLGLAIGGATVTVVGGIVFAAFGTQANDKEDILIQRCPTGSGSCNGDPAETNRLADEGKDAQTAANVGFAFLAVGATATGVFFTLALVDRDKSSAAAEEVSIRAVVTPSYGGLQGTF